MRGHRPAKSAVLHTLHGTSRPSRRRVAGPVADGVPEAPGYLQGAALALWNEIAPRLTWLSLVDSAALALWCCLEAEFRENPKGMIASRVSQLRLVADSLGLSPTARRRLQSSSNPAHGGDDGARFAAFLKNRPDADGD